MFAKCIFRGVLPALFLVSLSLFAAEEAKDAAATNTSLDGKKITQSKIDRWIKGTVTKVNSESGALSLRGHEMPFATAHAQMFKELQQKLANAKPEEKQAIIDLIKKDWKDKLEKAKAEKQSMADSDFDFHAPMDDSLVVLEEKEIKKVAVLEKKQFVAEKGESPDAVAEIGIVRIYEMPESTAASGKSESEKAIETSADKKESDLSAGEKLTLKDVQVGDTVMAGIDSKSNLLFTVIKKAEQKEGLKVLKEKESLKLDKDVR